MKKALALIGSLIVYIGLFQLFFHILNSLTADQQFTYFSLAISAYFVIAGSLFHRRLKIEWWQLWVSMNIIGYALSWVVWLRLEPWQAEIDFFIFIVTLTPFLIFTWGIVGVGFLCVRLTLFCLKKYTQHREKGD